MTSHKHFKQLVRARMAKTGESYSSARRHFLNEIPQAARPQIAGPHLAGNVPATTALRIVLTQAGLRDPRTAAPLSEPLVFGIAGGIGIAAFSFVYEAEDVATFYIAGRHSPADDCAYLRNAAARLGIEPVIEECTTEKKALANLSRMLGAYGPCIAWVDAASLPHRAMPEIYCGGGYHVVTIYSIDDNTALVGDLADEPVPVPLEQLAAARSRIKKQKNRLLALPQTAPLKSLTEPLRLGLQACCDGLAGKYSVPGYTANFTLQCLERWSQQLADLRHKEGWQQRFRPGGRLWQGLTSIYEFIEHYGTGGGLCRPLFAACLREAGDLLGGAEWHTLATRYAELGRLWTELANLALPDDVPLFYAAKQLQVRKAELINTGGSVIDVRNAWEELDHLGRQARHEFPLSASACANLREQLQSRVHTIYESEVAARNELQELLG